LVLGQKMGSKVGSKTYFKKVLKNPCKSECYCVRIGFDKNRSEGRQSYYNNFVAIINL
jgi:hypothetical protein